MCRACRGGASRCCTCMNAAQMRPHPQDDASTTPPCHNRTLLQSPSFRVLYPSFRVLLPESFFQGPSSRAVAASLQSPVCILCAPSTKSFGCVQLLPFNLYSYACELHPFMSIVRSICAVDINICGPTVQGPAGIGSVGDVVGEGTHATQPESSWPRMNARVLSMSG